jgi:hypothetical protein
MRRACLTAITAFGLLLLAPAAGAAPGLALTATDAVIGETIEADLQLSESPGATGEITFEVFAADDPTCEEPPLDQSTVTVTGEGQYLSDEFDPPAPGTYNWSAHYSGDGENEPADSLCSAGSKVTKATPTLTGDASDGVVGSAIHDEVTLSEGLSPTGEVTFAVYAPSDTTCTTPLDTDTVTVDEDTATATSPDFLAQQAGEFRWTASYSGDANNKAVILSCGAANQSSLVAKATPNLSGTATSSVVVGNTITDTVTLSGGFSPGDQIVFRAYGPGDGTCANPPAYEAEVTVSGNGPYSPPGFAPGPGLYRWTAEYEGDANNESIGLACNAANQASEVVKATPVLTGDASDGVVGTAIHDEVTLTGFSPTGQVTFSVYAPGDTTCSTPLATTTSTLSAGKATSANFQPQQTGAFRWKASYSGDADNKAATLACGATGQSSTVAKASPGLSGTATSAVIVGEPITDHLTLSGGFAPDGEIVFRVYGPGDETCSNPPADEEAVEVSGNGPYSSDFVLGPGLYRWTVSYSGDADNEAVSLGCGTTNQASAVGTISLILTSSASDNTVGSPVTATATLGKAAIPSGEITFRAFPPSDPTCAGTPAFSSSAKVSGIGTYGSAAFVPTKVGTYRWTVAYSGDPNHAPATTGCGEAASRIVQAQPSISGVVPQRATVGTAFTDAVTLQGGFAPRGTITFRIYGPVASGCAKASFVNTVAVNGNGTFSSDPFVALRPGRYSFVASYSGDAANQSASESCDSPTQVVQVGKRAPRVKPRAILIARKQISIRARLSGTVAPAGALGFRLYPPGDKRCARKPAFSGSISVKRNGIFSLGRYLATRPGIYRLSVGYSGDKRNQRYKPTCGGAQTVRVK